MNKNLRGLLTAIGLGAVVTVAGMFSSGCVVRGSATVRAPVVVVDTQPPPPRYETPRPRRGHVWLRGHWENRNGRWVWKRGRWQRARSGYVWEAGHWQRRTGRWHFVRGRWVRGRARVRTAVPVGTRPAPPPPRRRDYRRTATPTPAPAPTPPPRHVARPVGAPTTAPPAPQYKQVRPRRGFVWMRGHHKWDENSRRYTWIRGRWVPERAGKRWVPGRWERRSDYYVWIKGSWQ